MKDGKYEVGDWVVNSRDDPTTTAGKPYWVFGLGKFGVPLIKDDLGNNWWAVGDQWSAHPGISPGDTVRLVSGEPFTNGEYTATVDNVTADGIVLLTTGGWLAGALVEGVEALTVEAGKSYVARDGSVHGPMKKFEYGTGFVRAVGDGYIWNDDGTNRNANLAVKPEFDFVKEVVAAPASTPTTPEVAQWEPKVGDRVRSVKFMGVGKAGLGVHGEVIPSDYSDWYKVRFDHPDFEGHGDDGNEWNCQIGDIELVAADDIEPALATDDTCTIKLVVDFSDFTDMGDRFIAAGNAIKQAFAA